jgi:tetratricopeptide (TPR) repeat protein
MRERLWLFSLFLILCAGPLQAADDHHHPYGHTEKLGTVSFTISCSPGVQQRFERGVALMHSFWYDEAEKQFKALEKEDPACAMTYWGEAISLLRQLVSRPEEADLKRGFTSVRKAQAMGAKTQREADYVGALALFYRDYDKVDYEKRIEAYSMAMEKVYQRYPKDQQAAVFYALSLLTWNVDYDPLANPKKAIAILNHVVEENPNDPGAAHYLIHASDAPQLAQLGLPAARVYAQIAPAAPHALHMPSHIFARLGLWQEDIQSNLASLAAARQPSAMHLGAENQIHAMEFLEYAYLQTGEDHKAKAMVAEFMGIPRVDVTENLRYSYFDSRIANFPAMYALEMHRWKEAVALQPPAQVEPYNQAITYWARAVAAGHLRDVAAAQDAVDQYDAMVEATKKGKHAFTAKYMRTEQDEAHAWLAFAEGKNDVAIVLLRGVADKQDVEGKGEVALPAREMIADMLLEMGRPGDALVEYEKSMRVDPNRFNGLYGAARAGELSNQREKATAYLAQLLANCSGGAHSDRPELAHAKSSLAGVLTN